MKKYTYNFEIKDILTQFIAAFDDTVIKRYDKDRNSRQDVEVRYVFAPKQRVMYDIINKAQNVTLPVVTVDLKSVSYDSDRAFNKVNKLYNYRNEVDNTAVDMPTPINLEVSMSILGRYMQDVEQIISNFAPYTNPYIILTWREPSEREEDIEIRSEVLWNESITLNTPTETTYSDKFRIVADTSFTIKTWLFKNQNTDSAPIYFIENNLIAVEKGWSMSQPLTSLDYENFFNQYSESEERDNIMVTQHLSGTPEITNIYFNSKGGLIEAGYNTPITLNKDMSGNDIYNYLLLGDNYNQTTEVLLSSDNQSLMNNLTTFDTQHSGPLSGFIIPTEHYEVLSNNTLSISIPPLTNSGKVNIIIKNPAGWTSTETISGFYMIAE